MQCSCFLQTDLTSGPMQVMAGAANAVAAQSGVVQQAAQPGEVQQAAQPGVVQQAANPALPSSMGAMDIDDELPDIRPRFRRTAHEVDSPLLQLYDILG